MRLRLGDVELVVRRIEDDRITSISLDVAPAPSFARGLDGLVIRLAPARAAVRSAVKGARRALGRIFETARARLVRGKAEDGG
jgi:hypothetical protein